MEIKLKHIRLRDVASGFINNDEEGCFAFNGKLNIRPPYQREFIYKDKQKDEVIRTIKKGFPLNVMYWVDNGNGNYEILDGQQRTISFCEYIENNFSVDNKSFRILTEIEKEQILDYELMIYICKGNDKEKLDWFKTINIAGEKLTPQELRNAIYTSAWLTEMKKYFSKTSGPAFQLGSKYLLGSPIRQDYLETILKWISKNNIENYMNKCATTKNNADEEWSYFSKIIEWIKLLFTNYRAKEMKGLPWGEYYNQFSDNEYDPIKLEEEIKLLMEDDEVTDKKGIYEYLLSNKERSNKLNLRVFDNTQKRQIFEQQNGVCVLCKKTFKIEDMEADHILAWSLGGKTDSSNCQMLCMKCNRTKSNNK